MHKNEGILSLFSFFILHILIYFTSCIFEYTTAILKNVRDDDDDVLYKLRKRSGVCIKKDLHIASPLAGGSSIILLVLY